MQIGQLLETIEGASRVTAGRKGAESCAIMAADAAGNVRSHEVVQVVIYRDGRSSR